MLSYTQKIERAFLLGQKVVADAPFYAHVGKTLIPAMVEVRSEITQLIKKLEKDPELKKDVLEWFGTGFVADLALVSKLSSALS